MTGDPLDHAPSAISRRAWIAATLAGWATGAATASGDTIAAARSDLERELEAVRAIGRRAGLEPFRHSASAGYLVVGDVPDRFRGDALAICEALKVEFFEHFRGKGFALARPRRRLTVVALSDAGAYAAFQGEVRAASYGSFSLESNRVVLYDARSDREPGGRAAPLLNLQNLTHEAIHQLSFNSRLLPWGGDAPHWLVEGLAMYGETFRPRRARIGGLNRQRLDYLVERLEGGEAWLDLERLVTEDHLYTSTSQDARDRHSPDLAFQAYSQSWLLVHFLLTDPARLRGFRAYLRTLHQPDARPVPRREIGRGAAAGGLQSLGLAGVAEPDDGRGHRRLEEARRCLGDLSGLDLDLRRRMRDLPRRPVRTPWG